MCVLSMLSVCICLLLKIVECSVLSRVKSAIPWIVACQAPLSIGLSRTELSLPPSGDLPNPGIEPSSPVSLVFAGRFFTTAPPGKPKKVEASA